MNLGGIAPVLPALHGTVLQVGNNGLYGKKWEFFIQQLTDTVGYQQCDGGGGNGGWYYQDENPPVLRTRVMRVQVSGRTSDWKVRKSRVVLLAWW